MKESVLITGGSGLIGQHITELLSGEFNISWLVRKKHKNTPVQQYIWDPAKGLMEDDAIKTADYIINLSGENIGEHRWTNEFKKKIISSRVDSAKLLQKKLTEIPNKVKAIVCSAAIGIYKDAGAEWLNEESEKDDDFLATTCRQWEEANSHYPCRIVLTRIGLVLSMKGGALPQLITPVKLGVAPLFNNGHFYQSWIHIDDVAGIIRHALIHDVQGVVNAVSPMPVSQKELMTAIRKRFNRISIPFPVPGLLLKAILGEKAIIVLKGARLSCKKIQESGYQFRHTTIKDALKSM